MDISNILDDLNEAQRAAVEAANGHLLVLAGAGSGKTRVLVHRIVWYIQKERISPYGILAVTFTNKAAAEMRSRIEVLQRRSIGGLWVGTFHGIAHRLLRAHWQEAGLPENFQILDSEDQYRTIRRVLRMMELDESQYPPRELQWFINGKKDDGLRPQNLETYEVQHTEQLARIYQTYQTVCDRSGLVDFAELLLRTHELFRDQKTVLAKYQQRFMHILVDEFQDINTLQYAWLKILAGNTGSVFAVGDDDQSIYSWRGAKMKNMQRFQTDFPSSTLLRLEQNYRSTANILQAANLLITNNTLRLGKKLWTEGNEGDRIEVYAAYNEREEAQFVIDRIAAEQSKGRHYSDNAILYRVSAQSRVMEEELMQSGIPYRVFGGMRFYERTEIKDAIAYLRLAAFKDDDASFERIINFPARGIGQRTMEELRSLAKGENISLWGAAQKMLSLKMISARALGALEQFLKLIRMMSENVYELPLDEAIENVINGSGLIAHYRKEKGERGQARIDNIDELITATREFKVDKEEYGEMSPLTALLGHIALESGEKQAGAHTDCVNLMTLHASKGLEFRNVYLVGFEEGLFPQQRSTGDLVQLEEERRLCYVGITRAQPKLTIIHAQYRRLHGNEYYPQVSRFMAELPEELLSEVRLGTGETQTVFKKDAFLQQNDTGFNLGQRVIHAKFGKGVVLNLEGKGSQARVQVNFEHAGSKWLALAYANLQPA